MTCELPQAFIKYHSVLAVRFGCHCIHGYPCVVDDVIRMSSVRSSERIIMNLYFLLNPGFGINWCRNCLLFCLKIIPTISQLFHWDFYGRKASYIVLDLGVIYGLLGSFSLFLMAVNVLWLSGGKAFKLAVERGHQHGQMGMDHLRCILSFRTLLAQIL